MVLMELKVLNLFCKNIPRVDVSPNEAEIKMGFYPSCFYLKYMGQP